MKKMPLFSRPRSPAEIVRNLKEALNTLERGGDSKKQEKAQEDLSRQLTNMKQLLSATSLTNSRTSFWLNLAKKCTTPG